MTLIELILLGITIVLGQVLFVCYLIYGALRNIFTQKVLFLNEELSRLPESEENKYKIGKYVRFRVRREYEYPPRIKQKYSNHPEYRNLILKFEQRTKLLNSISINVLYVYCILLLILGVLYLALPSEVWAIPK